MVFINSLCGGKIIEVNCLQCESFAIQICGAFVDTMESVVRGGLIGGSGIMIHDTLEV